ncbi:uncharacterized protein BJ171DRAFT_262337 [Polychytrium aggregatum]|uniref:uncharacterized protein n=1 Tax=Polychytrium aggregatum TaxID=110093 RepID=UPI0022FEC814|nr:uncharacterized protein BJ171DRAFT_262337 [Polychytrium aggregatum]KAI9193448.1 hypothetical protein BJ171DRAFT_262337 [Polychytrium aggregatum]
MTARSSDSFSDSAYATGHAPGYGSDSEPDFSPDPDLEPCTDRDDDSMSIDFDLDSIDFFAEDTANRSPTGVVNGFVCLADSYMVHAHSGHRLVPTRFAARHSGLAKDDFVAQINAGPLKNGQCILQDLGDATTVEDILNARNIVFDPAMGLYLNKRNKSPSRRFVCYEAIPPGARTKLYFDVDCHLRAHRDPVDVLQYCDRAIKAAFPQVLSIKYAMYFGPKKGKDRFLSIHIFCQDTSVVKSDLVRIYAHLNASAHDFAQFTDKADATMVDPSANTHFRVILSAKTLQRNGTSEDDIRPLVPVDPATGLPLEAFEFTDYLCQYLTGNESPLAFTDPGVSPAAVSGAYSASASGPVPPELQAAIIDILAKEKGANNSFSLSELIRDPASDLDFSDYSVVSDGPTSQGFVRIRFATKRCMYKAIRLNANHYVDHQSNTNYLLVSPKKILVRCFDSECTEFYREHPKFLLRLQPRTPQRPNKYWRALELAFPGSVSSNTNLHMATRMLQQQQEATPIRPAGPRADIHAVKLEWRDFKHHLGHEAGHALLRFLWNTPLAIPRFASVPVKMTMTTASILEIECETCTQCDPDSMCSSNSTLYKLDFATTMSYSITSSCLPGPLCDEIPVEIANLLMQLHERASASSDPDSSAARARNAALEEDLKRVAAPYAPNAVIERFGVENNTGSIVATIQRTCPFCCSEEERAQTQLSMNPVGLTFQCLRCGKSDPVHKGEAYPTSTFLALNPRTPLAQTINNITIYYTQHIHQHITVQNGEVSSKDAHMRDPTPYLGPMPAEISTSFKEAITSTYPHTAWPQVLFHLLGDKWIGENTTVNDWYHFTGVYWKYHKGNREFHVAIIERMWALIDSAIEWYSFKGGKDLKHAQKTIDALKTLRQRTQDDGHLNKITAIAHLRFSRCREEFVEKKDRKSHLNVNRSCVVDLRTMECRRGFPEDYMTVSCNAFLTDPVTSETLQAMEEIETMIGDIFTDPAQLDWNQRFMASLLDGDTTEQFMVFCVGGGSNGKTLLANLIQRTLGEYSKSLPNRFLYCAPVSSSAPSPELEFIVGARYVTVEELDGSDNHTKLRMNASRIKMLVGAGMSSFRGMYGKQTQTRFSCKFMVLCNYEDLDLKAFSGSDSIVRRIVINPFGSHFFAKMEDYEKARRIDPNAPNFMANGEYLTKAEHSQAWVDGMYRLMLKWYPKYKEGGKLCETIPVIMKEATHGQLSPVTCIDEFLAATYNLIDPEDEADAYKDPINMVTQPALAEEFYHWFQRARPTDILAQKLREEVFVAQTSQERALGRIPHKYKYNIGQYLQSNIYLRSRLVMRKEGTHANNKFQGLYRRSLSDERE